MVFCLTQRKCKAVSENNKLIGREPNGYFARGNTISRGHGNPILAKMSEFKAMFLKAVTVEDILKAKHTLIALMDDPDPRVRVAAITVFLDRSLGKIEQTFDVNVTAETKPAFNYQALSDDELKQLQSLTAKAAGVVMEAAVIDATFQVQDEQQKEADEQSV